MKTASKKIKTNWSIKLTEEKESNSKITSFKHSTPIWKSSLSWKITFCAFLTIMLVQATVLALSIKNKEDTLLRDLRNQAHSAIAPMIDHTITDQLTSPINHGNIEKLVTSTIIEGLAIYNSNYDLLDTAGQPVYTSITAHKSLYATYRSDNGDSYEVIFRPYEINKNYMIVARIESKNIKTILMQDTQQSIIIMLLLSMLVTTVLMTALGKWLLEPLMFLRNNLEAAYKNPEEPNIITSPYENKDEISSAIKISEELIRQNALSLKKIKESAKDKIHRLAYYDTLTNLPNRILFIQKLYEKMKNIDKENDPNKVLNVITLDIDHFKDINDSMGHNVGDAILRAIGKRLKLSLPDQAMVARTGEDTFAISLSTNLKSIKPIETAEKIRSILNSEPFKVFSENFHIRASIGICTYPTDCKDPDQILKNADLALNRAKEEGRDTIREYAKDFDQMVKQRTAMLRDLRIALDNDDLQLFYQPQLDLKTGKVIGAEALLRWWKKDNSKDKGHFISPGVFIPVAEQSGLIIPIGAWVMEKACETARKWQKNGHNIRIAINVAAAQFHQTDIVGDMVNIINNIGIDPNLIEIEVTESVFMDDIKQTVKTLTDLHTLGIELAIDDFGTGYSSLSYLRQFPIDRLKIDQSFIKNALNNSDDAAIARTIVKLGHSLNLKVIAEGVETKEHEDFLLEQECDEVQGFRYSRPIPEDEFIAFIESYNGDIKTFEE